MILLWIFGMPQESCPRLWAIVRNDHGECGQRVEPADLGVRVWGKGVRKSTTDREMRPGTCLKNILICQYCYDSVQEGQTFPARSIRDKDLGSKHCICGRGTLRLSLFPLDKQEVFPRIELNWFRLDHGWSILLVCWNLSVTYLFGLLSPNSF